MFEELGILIAWIWLWGCAAFILNAISKLIYKPKGRIKATLHAILVCPIWPFALFSPEGRKVLLNRIQKL